jgi:hypothetical protein
MSLLRKGAINPVRAALKDPLVSTGFEDQDLTFFDLNFHPAFWTINTSPYSGKYALQGSGNETTYVTLLAKSLKAPYPQTLFTRFYINFQSLGGGSALYLFNIGKYTAYPYYTIIPQSFILGARNVSGTLYWITQSSLTPLAPFSLNQWYRVEVMASDFSLTCQLKINGTTIWAGPYFQAYKGYLGTVGFRLYPTSGGSITELIDSFAVGQRSWLDDRYLDLRVG